MKGRGNSVGTATIIALGLLPVVCSASRILTDRGYGSDFDDALDPIGRPSERAQNALDQRQEWAELEFEASKGTRHINNGDSSSEASFHKTLPHDEFGVVDEDAFNALRACILDGTIEQCEEVPAGIVNGNGFLANPLGGIAVDMAGAAGSALTIPPAPTLETEEFAAQLAEVYWMALTRDIPFSTYGDNPDTVAAADNLAMMPGFAKMNGVAVGPDGRPDPQTQLFRSSAVGVTAGPYVSQLLIADVGIDSITVTPKQLPFAPGVDYMTDFDEWLGVQNGSNPPEPEERDTERRFLRNARDLATMAATDTIYTEAFRGALVLLAEGAIRPDGFNGPYPLGSRQGGFVSFGVSHTMKNLGMAEMAQRSSWYQKWNVHMFARPEATAGTLHNVLNGNLNVQFDSSLLDNYELLDRVAERNDEMNGRTDRDTFLLSQAVREGGPAHPAYPAGHAVQNGAFATVLKSLVGMERGDECFQNPQVPDDDGLKLLPYTGDECLTFGGEINKLAFNVAIGRQMCGVHYRMDSEEGLRLGQNVAVRMLQQEIVGFPEEEGYEFRLFDGEKLRLEPDGSFFVDDIKCSGVLFEGAALC